MPAPLTFALYMLSAGLIFGALTWRCKKEDTGDIALAFAVSLFWPVAAALLLALAPFLLGAVLVAYIRAKVSGWGA